MIRSECAVSQLFPGSLKNRQWWLNGVERNVGSSDDSTQFLRHSLVTVHIGMNLVTHGESRSPRRTLLQLFADQILITDRNVLVATDGPQDFAVFDEPCDRSIVCVDNRVRSTQNNLTLLCAATINQLFKVTSVFLDRHSHHVVQTEADRHDVRPMLQHV